MILSHFLKNISKHCKLANLACKNSCTEKKSYHSTLNAINAMVIYPSAHCSWFFNMDTRYRMNSTHIYTYIYVKCVFAV